MPAGLGEWISGYPDPNLGNSARPDQIKDVLVFLLLASEIPRASISDASTGLRDYHILWPPVA